MLGNLPYLIVVDHKSTNFLIKLIMIYIHYYEVLNKLN